MYEYFHSGTPKQDNNGDFSWLAFRFEAVLTPRLKVWFGNINKLK